MSLDLDGQTVDLLEKQLARYQQIISRLAGNSVQTKTWCFTAAAALTTVAIDRQSVAMFATALILVGAFFYLDAYYLALERHFRSVSTDIGRRVAAGERVTKEELFVVASPRDSVSWQQIIRCGARSHTVVVYLVVALGLGAGLVVTAT